MFCMARAVQKPQERKWIDKIVMYLESINNVQNAGWQAKSWEFLLQKDKYFDWSSFVLQFLQLVSIET